MTSRPPAAVVPATIGRRVAAYAIDIAIAYGIVAVLIGVAAAIIAGVGTGWDETGLALMLVGVWAVIALAALTWALVYTAMQGGRGSIGQRTLRIRLYGADSGAAIGFGHALLRNIVWALATSIVVGYFTPLFDQSGKRQGWHDKATGAIVGDRQATAAAAVAPAPAPPTSPIAMAPTAPALLMPVVPPPPPRITSAPAIDRASRAPAAPATGMISHVPGITQDPIDVARSAKPAEAYRTVAPVAAVPVPSEPAPAPVRVVPAASAAAAPTAAAPIDDVDATRAAAPVPPPAQRAALYPEAPVLAVLTWDDGSRMAVYGPTIYGRNPAPEDGKVSVAVRDETLSLSKTHFEIGSDPAGVWVVDRHSTNGTILVRDGGRHALAAGTRTPLRVGDRLEFGDRSAAVASGS